MNRPTGEYGVVNDLLNGANGYGEDYKSSKFSSSSIQRNRSQRRNPSRIGGSEVIERYGKLPISPYPVSNTAVKSAIFPPNTTVVAQETDPNKKPLVSSTSPVAGLASPLPSTLTSSTYGRRNTGPRGRARGGILPTRGLNRSRSQTGVESIVPVSAVSTGSSTAATSTAALHPEDYPPEMYYFEGGYPAATAAGVDVNAVPAISSAGPTFMPSSYYFNTPQFISYDADRLKELLRSQIEYYFSEENLQRDFFLRRKMDESGFLPISLIASFHRVQGLTQDVSLVVDALANSTTVEIVDGVKLRTRNNPEKWPLVSYFDVFRFANFLFCIVGQSQFCWGNESSHLA